MRASASFFKSLSIFFSLFDQSAFVTAHHDIQQCAGFIHAKHPHWHIVLSAQTDGRKIHYPELALENLIVSQSVKLGRRRRSEEHTSELQSRAHTVRRRLLEKKHTS